MGDLPPGFDRQSLSSQPDAYRWLWHEWQLLWHVCSEPARSRERIVSNDVDITKTHLTHIENLKNPIQLQPPTRNLSLPIARSKVFDKFVLPGQFLDLLLYFPNTPVIKSTLVEGSEVYVTGLTHFSNRSIAFRTDSLSLSVFFPSVPRLSASQTLAHSIPRSTQSCSLAILS